MILSQKKQKNEEEYLKKQIAFFETHKALTGTRLFVSAIICLLFGWLGVHNFINRNYKSGILQLGFSLLSFFPISFFWAGYDFFKMIWKRYYVAISKGNSENINKLNLEFGDKKKDEYLLFTLIGLENVYARYWKRFSIFIFNIIFSITLLITFIHFFLKPTVLMGLPIDFFLCPFLYCNIAIYSYLLLLAIQEKFDGKNKLLLPTYWHIKFILVAIISMIISMLYIVFFIFFGSGINSTVKIFIPAMQGNAKAQYALGKIYRHDDINRTIKWYSKSAEQGYVLAQFELGTFYDSGIGTPKNYKEAAEWYLKAAEQGHTEAQFNIGSMYYYGQGVPQDYVKAFKWYSKAAEQNNTRAQYCVANFLYYGKGIPKDYVKAFEWYSKVAEQGNIDAKFNLASMYYLGEGVPQDYTKAFNLYTEIASKDSHPEALLYQEGGGCSLDYTEAVDICTKIPTKHHYSDAKFYLALMYFNGRGTTQNYLESLKLLRSAAWYDNTDAIRFLKEHEDIFVTLAQ